MKKKGMKPKNKKELLALGVLEEDIKVCSNLIGIFYYFESILIPESTLHVCINTYPSVSRIIEYIPKEKDEQNKEKIRFFVRGMARKITDQESLTDLVVEEMKKFLPENQLKEVINTSTTVNV